MPTIIQIEFKRRRPERFVVQWDNGETHLFSPEIAATYRFAPGKEFSDAAYRQILREDGVRRAKDQMLRYLGIRAHSRQELRRKTLAKGFQPDHVDEALDALENLKLIDDAQFVRQFIHNELTLRPCSKNLLLEKLLQKGVDRAILQPILDEIYATQSPEEIIHQIAARFLQRQRQLTPPKRTEKLIRHLQGKGFEWELINWVLYDSGLIDRQEE